MALRNAFGELALETTQVANEVHLAAMHSHLSVEDGHMQTMHSDLVALYEQRKQGTDIFANQVVSERINQIEVPLNDTNWINFVNTIFQHGTAVQSAGQVSFQTGTNVNGYYGASSLDQVKYRAGAEIGWGFTFRFPTAGEAASYQRIGVADSLSWNDGVWFGYEGNAPFGLIYKRNGVVIWNKPIVNWTNLDKYTLNSVEVFPDVTKNQLARVRAGLFGHRGFIVEICSPDGKWVEIASYNSLNVDSVPVFSEFDLRVVAEVRKTSGTASNLQIVSACWAGWTGISLTRMSDEISDRSLAQTTRTVVYGKSSAGGGTYVAQKVSPSGASIVDASGSSVTVSNFPAIQTVAGNVTVSGSVSVSNLPAEYPLPSAQVSTLTPQKDALTNAQLRAADVNVADSGEREYLHYATDITNIGDNTVLTPAAGKRIRIRWIYAINDPTASTPCKIRIRFGTKPDIYNVWALSKRQVVTGAVNEPLIVNLSATANIAFTVIYEEI